MKNREDKTIFPRRHELASASNCKREARSLSSEARDMRITQFNEALKNMESYVRLKN
ncbi:hypothetical protein Xentx_01711 [Xenorhabdus thuongxuanensis]|uniref:Uncharacterized protein n=1 Tax=Xenorhabdus thuongxuanensis TaxID=1873484 RepID=A0A1Q5U3R0_9GAMM|nr:hypothetical protein Xentx_01711 [Xenorhabdus thuongxuanensis]